MKKSDLQETIIARNEIFFESDPPPQVWSSGLRHWWHKMNLYLRMNLSLNVEIHQNQNFSEAFGLSNSECKGQKNCFSFHSIPIKVYFLTKIVKSRIKILVTGKHGLQKRHIAKKKEKFWKFSNCEVSDANKHI